MHNDLVSSNDRTSGISAAAAKMRNPLLGALGSVVAAVGSRSPANQGRAPGEAAPKPLRTTRSLGLMRFSCIASSRTSGMEPAEVLP